MGRRAELCVLMSSTTTRHPRAVGADPRHASPATFLAVATAISPAIAKPSWPSQHLLPPSIYCRLTCPSSSSTEPGASTRQRKIPTNRATGNRLPRTRGSSSCPIRPMDQQPTTDMEKKDASLSALQRSLSAVTYCCGACGYDLRLRSSDRNTAGIVGGGYGRAARRGVVPFDAIDDARFGHADEFRCVDVRARRLFVRRTRLLCRKCGASLGFAYDDRARARADDATGSATRSPRYDIKIRALQPLADDDDASPPPPSEGA